MNVCALVVTYNRLNLLKENISSLINQNYKLKKLIIIDNASTDGTYEFINNNYDNNEFIDYIRLNKNIGGSGGFSKGIEESFKYDYDYLWIMDDDTIVTKNSLDKLIESINNLKDLNIGFLCSKVLWINNDVHLMNIPQINSIISQKPFNIYDPYLLVNACSFVSVLIRKSVISEIGLPYKEFFIWGDDTEYTKRITERGYFGIYNPDSVVVHKTKTNYSTDILLDNKSNGWKYKYGIRNKLFLIKRKNKVKYIYNLFKTIFILPYKIIKYRKKDKKCFIKIVIKAAFSSILFNPKIHYIRRINNEI